MANVHFVGHLATREANFFGVDDDDIVTAINVGGEVGLVFAANAGRYLASQTTDNGILSVNDDPLLVCGPSIGRNSFVA